jgi:outer membrane beta-barrel protein
VTVGLAAAGSLSAQQTVGQGLELALTGGAFAPQEPSFTADEAGFQLSPAVLLGGRIGYNFPFRLFVQADVDYSPAKLEKADGEKISLNALILSGTLGYNIQAGQSFQLFFNGGAGLIQWKPEALATENDLTINVGLGLRYFVTPTIAIRADFRDRYAPSGLSATRRQLEPGLGYEESQAANHNIELSAGLSFFFGGGTGDRDGDGVGNDLDLCPDTPLGARVDSGGCPVDSDGDRVADIDDRCPDTPAGAAVDAAGCPIDADLDGIPDGLDRCPDTPAGSLVDENGCANDADADGVPDQADRCPNTPAGVAVDETGCPLDSDGDGVPDDVDQCPGTTPGAAVDETGCALGALERELLESGRLVLRGVEFESSSARLRPGSQTVLADAGRALLQLPQLRIEVRGHTDATGGAEANRLLSQQRAQAALDYLVGAFPELRGRLSARGVGENEPIASNQTEAGRRQNRRVELVVTGGR